MNTEENKPKGLRRALWPVLAVVALVAGYGAVLYADPNDSGKTDTADDWSGPNEPAASVGSPEASAESVAAKEELATIEGTFFYIDSGSEGGELWSWTPGRQPESRYKSAKSKLFVDATVSPDGRHLAFLVPGSEYPKVDLVVRDLTKNTERTIAKGLGQGGEYTMDAHWAPDGRPMILTQTRFGTAGIVLRWFNIETGDKSQEIEMHGSFPRPVPRGDDGYDLYYLDLLADGVRDIMKREPGGRVTATGLGPAVEDALGQPLLGLGAMSQGADQACVTVGSPSGIRTRVLNCKIVLDVATKMVVYSPDGGFKGPVLFLDDGRTIGRFSTFVSMRAADGSELARVDEPALLRNLALLTHTT
ncbi:hypothetical protein AB0I28_27110 [Phytomonospora sp. NPDC050363]|uniref:hypothetical protein n=1 Tax=Phytomonospora sp. NPDC050363 TaxID=3155642 RepID=UPI00340E019F